MSITSLLPFLLMQFRGVYSFQDLLNRPLFVETLAFLIVFAVVFAVLSNINVFKDKKGVTAIIAIAVGLLSLQLGSVVNFFLVIFPHMGIGLAVLLVLMILAGAFIDFEGKGGNWVQYIIFGVGAFIFLVTVYTSFSDYSFFGNVYWDQYWSSIISAILIIGAIVVVILSTKGGSSS